MAYTTLKLITNAFYESGVVSRNFETVGGSQVTDGLEFLNDILGDKTVENGLIPYFQEHEFTGVVGQEKYFIENLISIDLFVFYINSIRYETEPVGRKRFFGTSRADNIESLPGIWHLEREFGGASIYIYFKPDRTYPMTIWGQFRLEEVTLMQDLSLTFDRFYINYLKFALAKRICEEFNYSIPPGVAMQVKRYEDNISKKSGPLDMSLQKISTLQRRGGINYGQVNIGKGWTV
ncbi:MAG TPA: hypothetical protein VLB84_03625 [Bacteroidia bacterium]|nr:hypothetical protein [Bacteroidia bacterium]